MMRVRVVPIESGSDVVIVEPSEQYVFVPPPIFWLVWQVTCACAEPLIEAAAITVIKSFLITFSLP
jgi:hypothetical protein